MTAQIIQFPVRDSLKWPDGVLGTELAKMAELVHRRGLERGNPITMEHARRSVLKALEDAFS